LKDIIEQVAVKATETAQYIKSFCSSLFTAVDMGVCKTATMVEGLGAVIGGPPGVAVGVGFVVILVGGILLPNYVKQFKWLPWNRF
jgi:hypothetical protein